jgi:hypothetical protein
MPTRRRAPAHPSLSKLKVPSLGEEFRHSLSIVKVRRDPSCLP